MADINIVLAEPRIPGNTGNIARTCAVTGAALHLIRPLGFEINDKTLKRAGLDYWDKLNVYYYDSIDDFFRTNPDAVCYFFTTKAKKIYSEINYPKGCYIFFGREDAGLPEDLLAANYERCVRIPMRDTLRSLNLSNSAAIAVYEILRQWKFEGLETEGRLTKYDL